MIRKTLFPLLFLCLLVPLNSWASQDASIEYQAKREPASVAIAPSDHPVVSSFDYDYGWVKQGSRKGKWTLATTSVSYTVNPDISAYFDIDQWDRLGVHDYTASTGAYYKFKDDSVLNAEIGFGGEARYLYRFKSQLEYQRKINRALSWEWGSRYLNYSANDTFLIYPGLIYYFGDNSVSLNYNHAIIESRGSGSSGTLRGNFVLTDHISAYAGAAVGQWLYDIFELSASHEFGYIGFAGFRYKCTPWLSATTGFSYSMEKPGFIKRSAEAGFSIRF